MTTDDSFICLSSVVMSSIFIFVVLVNWFAMIFCSFMLIFVCSNHDLF